MQLSRALFLSSERTRYHGACFVSVAASMASRAREYSYQRRTDSKSIWLSLLSVVIGSSRNPTSSYQMLGLFFFTIPNPNWDKRDLEYVGTTAIVVGIDQDFEVVVQVLAYVPPQFGRDDQRGLGVITMNSEIHGVSCVENPYFRPLGWQLAFVGFPLTELHNGFGGLPEQVVQGSVELWGVINRSCFRINPSGLALCG